MTVTFDTLKAATRLARKPASPKSRRPRFQTATEQRSDRLSQQRAPRRLPPPRKANTSHGGLKARETLSVDAPRVPRATYRIMEALRGAALT